MAAVDAFVDTPQPCLISIGLPEFQDAESWLHSSNYGYVSAQKRLICQPHFC